MEIEDSALRSKRFTSNFFIKFYYLEDLLDLDWESRVSTIECLSTRHDLIPEVIFLWENSEKLYYQQRRIRKVLPEQTALPSVLRQLALELDGLLGAGFVHGDINFKNLLFDGISYKLIDLEPSLRQRRKGRVTLMYTPPYISVSDYETDRLSQLTDKIGFYFFCRRLLDKTPIIFPIKEMRRIQSGHSLIEKFLGLKEYDLIDLSYENILMLLVQQKKLAGRLILHDLGRLSQVN